MGGKSRQITVGFNYFWGLHCVPCAAPIDGIAAFEVDSREAWVGFVPLGALQVNALQLFGGNEREGGVGGHIDVIDGQVSTVNDYLQQVLGSGVYDTSNIAGTNTGLVPAFRGVVSLVFRQFYWGNLPRQKNWRVLLRNIFSTAPVIDGEGNQSPWLPGLAPVCREYRVEDASIFVVLDNSGSMASPAEKDPNLRTAVKSFITDTLTPAANQGSTIALRLQIFSEGGREDSFERIPYTAADEAAALAWVDGYGAPGGFTLFNYGVEDAPQFYDDADTALLGTEVFTDFEPASFGNDARIQDNGVTNGLQRIMVFFSDGAATTASSAEEAAAITAGIQGVEVHGLGIETVGDLNLLDNTGGAVVTDDSADSLNALIAGPFMSRGDLNAMHILRHIHIGTNAGGTGDSDSVGASFASAALTCAEECMGLSLFWDKKQMSRDEFRKLVESHANCRSRFDETTEQWEVKLIRPLTTAQIAAAPRIEKAQIVEWISHHLPQQDQLPNKVTLSYTDRENGKPAAITQTNVAAMLSEPNPHERNVAVALPGITYPPLAEAVLQREVNARTRPLRNGQIRLAYLPENMNEGDEFVLTDDRFDIDGEICRVEELEDTDGLDNSIIVRFTQDAWGEGVSLNAGTTVGQDDIATTGVADLTPQNSTVFFLEEASYYDLVFARGQTDVDEALVTDDGLGLWHATSNRPTASHSNVQVALQGSSSTQWVFATVADFMPTWTLEDELSREADDTVFVAPSNGREAEIGVGDIIQINDERMRVDSISINTALGRSVFIVGRGILDTVPAVHAAGSTIMAWEGPASTNSIDYTDGEVLTARFLPRTSGRQLDVNSAADQLLTFDSRAIRPYPVGKLQVEGSYAPEGELSGTVDFTWAHRNRLTQTSETIQDHTDDNITPEVGTTLNRIRRILEQDGTIQFTDTAAIASPETAVSGTTDLGELIPEADANTYYGEIGVEATRGGFTNWQTPFVRFLFSPYASPSIGLNPDPDFDNVAVLYRFNAADGVSTLPSNDGYVTNITLEYRDSPVVHGHTTTNVLHYETAMDLYQDSGFLGSKGLDITDTASPAAIHESLNFTDAAGSMTIEGWLYLIDGLPGGEDQVIFSTVLRTSDGGADDHGLLLLVTDGGSLEADMFTGVNLVQIMDFNTDNSVVPFDEWIHVAAVRSGSRNWEFFLNGVSVGTASQAQECVLVNDPDASPPFQQTVYPVIAGSRETIGDSVFNGHFDSFRWTMGVARYLGPFTPEEFPDVGPSPSPSPPPQPATLPISYARLNNTATARSVGSSPMGFDNADTQGSPSVWAASPNETRLTAPTGTLVAVISARAFMDSAQGVAGDYDEVIIRMNGVTTVARQRLDLPRQSRNGASVIVPCSAGDYFEMIYDGTDSGFNIAEDKTIFTVRFY